MTTVTTATDSQQVTATATASWLRLPRPLPEWAVRLALAPLPDGMGKRGRNSRLFNIAKSAHIAGWSREEWRRLIELGPLAEHVRRPRADRPPISDGAVTGVLGLQWTEAGNYVERNPPLTGEEISDHVAPFIAARAREAAGDADLDLRPDDRAVLLYAAAEVERRGMTRVALTRRGCADAIADSRGGTPNTVTAGRALARLCASGLLTLHSRGRAGTGRANIYRVVPATSPQWRGVVHRQMDTNTYGPQGSSPTYGPPPDVPMDHPTTEEEAVPTIAIEVSDETYREFCRWQEEKRAEAEAAARRARLRIVNSDDGMAP